MLPYRLLKLGANSSKVMSEATPRMSNIRFAAHNELPRAVPASVAALSPAPVAAIGPLLCPPAAVAAVSPLLWPLLWSP